MPAKLILLDLVILIVLTEDYEFCKRTINNKKRIVANTKGVETGTKLAQFSKEGSFSKRAILPMMNKSVIE
jgi:hypothetical protein